MVIRLPQSLITTHSFDSGVLEQGKHLKHTGQWTLKTRIEHPCTTATVEEVNQRLTICRVLAEWRGPDQRQHGPAESQRGGREGKV